VRNGSETVVRRSLYLLSGFPWRLDAPEAFVDEYGQPQPNTGPTTITGATVEAAEHAPFVADLLRTPGLGTRVHRIYFIGRNPGEIAVWPSDPLPAWPAIWAVPFGRRGRAVYCGSSIDAEAPTAHRTSGRAARKLWHHVLWQCRQRITPPREPALRTLWRR
jgi:hypothetical protein